MYLSHLNIKQKSKYDYPTKPKLSIKPDGMYLSDGKTFINKKIYSIKPNQFNRFNQLDQLNRTNQDQTEETSYMVIIFDKLNDIYTCWSNFCDSVKKRIWSDYQIIHADDEFSL